MIRPPPISTLFPYTTLFRSHDLGHTPFGHSGERMMAELMRDYGGFEHNLQTLRILDVLEVRYPEFPGDRKSTRLNSSHSQISYAVFCLKKKKNLEKQRRYET